MSATIQPLQASKSAAPAALPAHLQPGIPADLADLALLDIKAVSALVGLKATSIYGKVAAKEFPEPIRMGQRCTRWKAGDVRAWLNEIQKAQAEDLKQRQQERAKKASNAAQAKRVSKLTQAAEKGRAPVSGACA